MEKIIIEMKDDLGLKEHRRDRTRVAFQKQKEEESKFSKMDSSVVKKIAFERKLRHYTTDQQSSMGGYLREVNLTQYISDVVDAIVEAKLSMADISSYTLICVRLHEKYADFAPQLLEAWRKVILSITNQKV